MKLFGGSKAWLSTCLVVLVAVVAPVQAIWPAPRNITTGQSTLWIKHGVFVTYNGGIVCWSSSSPAPSCMFSSPSTNKKPMVLQLPWTYGFVPPGPKFSSRDIVTGGVSRALDAILNKNFVPWKLYARNKVQETEAEWTKPKTYITRLEITQTGKDTDSTWKPVAGEVDESYSLTLDTKGTARIQAVSAVGVLRALESFTQLFFKHSQGSVYTSVAPVSITDAPEYPHRGILMDVARNWYPIENIFRTLDAMSWNKMNRLHLHVTDSQAWPLEIPSMPDLHRNGAYAKGLSYSPSDVRAIQTYAIHRGIEVIFEIDTPGHIGIVAETYPDLITAWGAEPWTTYCAEPPCGQFRLNEPKVDKFLDKLMDDLLPRLAPYTAYFHTGGDEVNFQEYLLDPTVGTNDSAVIGPLIQKFTDKNHARVRKAGLIPFVWEEIPASYNITIGEDVVVQSWLGGTAIADLTAKGHKVIDSNYNYWYLDCGRGAWLTFENGEAFDGNYPFNDWCGPTKSWGLIYSYDPRADLTEEQAKLVLGGEVAAWSEEIDETNLDNTLWPRASAAGEVLWSGRTVGGQNRSQIEAAPRLNEFRERMVARGVRAAPITMVFCTQGMDGSTCELPA
ncbi:family 20 glycoside hydrolase [Apiospora rasikravindrae]|uniref:Beta-hexosaminidase n=1 Tax=Apiospora rasikravindrae TaxID=990691 RepID=A0ABR1UB24_9PEZI